MSRVLGVIGAAYEHAWPSRVRLVTSRSVRCRRAEKRTVTQEETKREEMKWNGSNVVCPALPPRSLTRHPSSSQPQHPVHPTIHTPSSPTLQKNHPRNVPNPRCTPNPVRKTRKLLRAKNGRDEAQKGHVEAGREIRDSVVQSALGEVAADEGQSQTGFPGAA